MHLSDLLALRSVPAAGISIGITRRCPLSCSHCSTNSTRQSEQHPENIFTGFVNTFTEDHHPNVIAMSGGEALLRPRLVQRLAETARRVGTKSLVLSGLFFANHGTISKNIKNAIRSVDHFSVSMDAFHEAEVPRENVFRVLETVLSYGLDVSIHLVGVDKDDPYLVNATDDIQRNFGGSIPILVNTVSWFGRARDWLKIDPETSSAMPQATPCMMAAWPVMSYDGTIVGCGNDDVIDSLPAHLRLGHAQHDSWQVISEKAKTSHILRAIRLFGPEYVAESYAANGKQTCNGYCQTCMSLLPDSTLDEQLEQVMARGSTRAMEDAVSLMHRQAGAASFARLHAVPEFADLITLGAPA